MADDSMDTLTASHGIGVTVPTFWRLARRCGIVPAIKARGHKGGGGNRWKPHQIRAIRNSPEYAKVAGSFNFGRRKSDGDAAPPDAVLRRVANVLPETCGATVGAGVTMVPMPNELINEIHASIALANRKRNGGGDGNDLQD